MRFDTWVRGLATTAVLIGLAAGTAAQESEPEFDLGWRFKEGDRLRIHRDGIEKTTTSMMLNGMEIFA